MIDNVDIVLIMLSITYELSIVAFEACRYVAFEVKFEDMSLLEITFIFNSPDY